MKLLLIAGVLLSLGYIETHSDELGLKWAALTDALSMNWTALLQLASLRGTSYLLPMVGCFVSLYLMWWRMCVEYHREEKAIVALPWLTPVIAFIACVCAVVFQNAAEYAASGPKLITIALTLSLLWLATWVSMVGVVISVLIAIEQTQLKNGTLGKSPGTAQ